MEMETGEWTLLSAHFPGLPPEPVGILLSDTADELYVRMRTDWWDVAPDKDEVEIWRQVADELEEKGRELGAAQVMDWLDNTASHVLQIGMRQEVQFLNIKVTLNSLFRQHVLASSDRQDRKDERREVSHRIDAARYQAAGPGQRQRSLLYEYRLHAAVAAAFLLAALLVSKWESLTMRPQLSPDAISHESNALATLSQLPDQLLTLRIDPVRRPLRTERHRSRRRHTAEPLHKHFELGSVSVHLLPSEPVEISPPPSYVAVEMSSPELPYFAFPEVPPFRERRHRIIQFLSILATPFKSLFSSSRTLGPSAFD
jgi:hypothetical protein